jgi:site-specific recombinase XerD
MLLDGFCDWLLERGFSWHPIRAHLANVSHLNKWLSDTRGSCAGGLLSRREIEGFVEAYRCRCRNRGSLEEHLKRVGYSISRFVEFLSQKGLFDPVLIPPIYQPLLEGYLAWMREHRHAAESTLEIRRHGARQFLESLKEEATPEGLSDLRAKRVEDFFIDYARGMGRASRRSMQTALRTFLFFCFREGYIRQRLDRAVPTLRTYKLARVPRGLSERQAQAVLQSVDRTTAAGCRDYAILTLLHTYGVRGGQVRVLQLNDILWAEDQILFRAAKGGKDSLLPLTHEVGKSLLDYLQNARPCSAFREVFLTCRAPHHPLPKSNSLSEIVRRHLSAAGIEVRSKGSHTFRHAFATRMVAEGHPFKAVADVLGHRYLSTTFIYTKVDFNALSQAALEWPKEVR